MLRCLQRLFVRAASAALAAALGMSMAVPLVLGVTTVAHAAVTMPANPNTANLVLICRFSGDSDNKMNEKEFAASTQTRWQSMMSKFNAVNATGTYGTSFKEYVGTASKGKLNVQSVFPQNTGEGNAATLTYLDLDMTADQYGSAENDHTLFGKIAEAFNAKYSSYDITQANLDDDAAHLDNVMVFLQLPNGKTVTSHAGNAASYGFKLRDVAIDDYEVMGLTNDVIDYIDAIPAHEYLHTFGAVDLYRANGSGDFVTGWDMMGKASRSALPLAVTASDMGWGTVEFADAKGGEYTLDTYTSGNRHAIAFKSPLNDDEYFVAEYRKGNLEGVNGYQVDKMLGGKSATETNGSKDGIIIYRVNENYGPKGDRSGNKVDGHDYLYVFRPTDTATNNPGGDAAGDVKQANLTVGQNFGSATQSDGIANKAICYSDGTNSQITVDVVSQEASGLKIKITIPDYADRSLWDATLSDTGAKSFLAERSDTFATALVGNTVYGVASGASSTVVVEKAGDTWKQIGNFADISKASITSADGKLFLAGTKGNDVVSMAYQNGAWADLPAINGGASPRVASHDGVVYVSVLKGGANKSCETYRLANGAWQQVGGALEGTYFTDAVMLDATHLAVADFMGKPKPSVAVHTLSGNNWSQSDNLQMTPRSISSTAVGGNTYVYVSNGAAGGKDKLCMLGFDGKLTEVSGTPETKDAKLSSDGTDLFLTYTDVASTPGKTYVFTADATANQLEFKQLGDPVASPTTGSSETVVTGGKAYTLVSNGGTVQLRSHNFGPAVHKIVYELNGGTNNADNPATYTEGTGVALKDASKPGYRFDGWYKETTFVTKVERIAEGQTGDVTLYAKFTANTYGINYVLDGGANDSANPATYIYGVGVASFKPAAKAGHTFDGWYADAGFTSKVESINTTAMGSVTLYAKWSVSEEPAPNPTPTPNPTPDGGNSGNNLSENINASGKAESANSADKRVEDKSKRLSDTGSAVLMIAVPVLLTLAAGLALMALCRGKE